MTERHDVVILGGGLAGLTLAIQLKRARPGAKVLVVDKREGMAPEAAFKVGESSQPIAAFYFGEMIGMRDHIEQHQLPKYGLRFVFPADGNHDITRRTELGPPGPPPAGGLPSYQLDRGRFENELAVRVSAAGVELRRGCRVEGIELSDDGHSVTLWRDGRSETVAARWVVDAAGRAALLKTKLGLHKEVPHRINASWFRVRGRVDLDDWSDDEQWLGRIRARGQRMLSTCHLMGEGYWVWLIPLASGSHSIGIVADPRFHPFEQIDTLDGSLEWLSRHEPQLAGVIAGRRNDVQDFLTIEDFSLGAKRVFSPQRWALTGDAGVFLDPFISPGSDFIAIANTLITDAIARDLAGEDVADRVERFNDLYLHLFDTRLEEYVDQYELLGNSLVVTAKRIVDNIAYHAVAVLFAKGRIAELPFNPAIAEPLERILGLMGRIQSVLLAWHRLEPESREGVFLFPPQAVGTLREMMVRTAEAADEDALRDLLRSFAEVAEAVAVLVFHRAASRLPGGGVDPDRRIDPYAIGLDPERSVKAGLTAGRGLTLAEARARVEGLAELLDDASLEPALRAASLRAAVAAA
jgi:flavin-dependent dehydrogenase